MNKTLESYSPMANVGYDKNIRNMKQSAQTVRSKQLENASDKNAGNLVRTLAESKQQKKFTPPSPPPPTKFTPS